MSDAELCRLMGTGQESALPLTDRRFTALDGVPAQDDPELAVLMQAVRRLPRDRVDTVIESMLRCALGYSRTGNWEFLTRLASNALVTFRTRRDPENQKALDAVPADIPAQLRMQRTWTRYSPASASAQLRIDERGPTQSKSNLQPARRDRDYEFAAHTR